MKVAVFGARGMLGSQVVKLARESGLEVFPLADIKIEEETDVWSVLKNLRPDVVVNCAGSIGIKSNDSARMIRSNSVGPHMLAKYARFFSSRLIHISTDCVFSGDNKGYWNLLENIPDPHDVYGISKYLGEKIFETPEDREIISVIRTSFIGVQHGLVSWAVASKGKKIEGWERAWWSGSTDKAVANGIVELIEHKNIPLVHLATRDPVSKYNVLCLLNEKFNLHLEIEPTVTPKINRALEPSWILPSINEALEDVDHWKLG